MSKSEVRKGFSLVELVIVLIIITIIAVIAIPRIAQNERNMRMAQDITTQCEDLSCTECCELQREDRAKARLKSDQGSSRGTGPSDATLQDLCEDFAYQACLDRCDGKEPAPEKSGCDDTLPYHVKKNE